MKLIRARATNFKSIDDSGWVDIDDVTCMVGKNESGKTAFLSALRRLNPVTGVNGDFDLKDYPRKGYVRYKRNHDEEPAVAISAMFLLTPEELTEIEGDLGHGVLRSREVTASKNYNNEMFWEVDVDERSIVRHILDSAGLPMEIQQHAEPAQTCQELIFCLEDLDVKPSSVDALVGDLKMRFAVDVRTQIINKYLTRYMPRFVYFDEYSNMRGRISIEDLRQRREAGGDLDDADRTFLSLLMLVGAKLDDLESQTSYEYLKAELESASIGISDEIFEYWNQNKQLRVEFDLSSANPSDPPPLNKGTILHVRIWNNRHRVSVPFDERSKGFVWFFSFLAYFAQIEEQEDSDLVLLLDEPGLNLHAMAQHDFLRFIDERLATKHQVVYTTHSPFMINLKHLSRIRTVQDLDDLGTTVAHDMLTNDQETVFPLQVALGHQLAHTLFLAPHCLMVNSPSDLIYLQVLGELTSARGRMRLDPRWVVIPVGGADNLPAFVSLLGENYVSVAVMMDVTPRNKEKLEALNTSGMLRGRSLIKWVEVAKVRTADIEDLLDPKFYLNLVNRSHGGLIPRDLTMRAITDSNPRIVQRIQTHFETEGLASGQFDSYRPAAYLLERHDELRHDIDEATIDRAASLFERINALLPSNGASPSAVDPESARTLAPTP